MSSDNQYAFTVEITTNADEDVKAEFVAFYTVYPAERDVGLGRRKELDDLHLVSVSQPLGLTDVQRAFKRAEAHFDDFAPME